MKRTLLGVVAACSATLAVMAGIASASMMATHVTAKLTGMGEHGTVSLTVNANTHKVCWEFKLPMVRNLSGASIHTGKNGRKLLELGMRYAARGCTSESAMTLDHLAAMPKDYYVWVDVRGRMGDLRGQLHTGM